MFFDNGHQYFCFCVVVIGLFFASSPFFIFIVWRCVKRASCAKRTLLPTRYLFPCEVRDSACTTFLLYFSAYCIACGILQNSGMREAKNRKSAQDWCFVMRYMNPGEWEWYSCWTLTLCCMGVCIFERLRDLLVIDFLQSITLLLYTYSCYAHHVYDTISSLKFLFFRMSLISRVMFLVAWSQLKVPSWSVKTPCCTRLLHATVVLLWMLLLHRSLSSNSS